jgi:glycosyltransferase involved in cell wall biosynthesis
MAGFYISALGARPRVGSVPGPPIDVLVATFNSARDLEECLTAARRYLPVHRLIVVDRNSTDGSPDIARRCGAEVHSEEVGLGYARHRALELARTELVLFLDSDVILVRADFYARALEAMARPGTGAVAGGSVGHPFVYGLPFGLTLLPRQWAREVPIPREAQGYETYPFRRALRRARRKVRYVPDSMEHRSAYRTRHWPEWQGAQLRQVADGDLRELAFALIVVVLLLLNGRTLRHAAYLPIFWARLLRGYLAPTRWGVQDRRRAGSPSS